MALIEFVSEENAQGEVANVYTGSYSMLFR
jgi:hypothetical protein